MTTTAVLDHRQGEQHGRACARQAEATRRRGWHRRGGVIPRFPVRTMIDEIAVERVLLLCPENHWQREVDVNVVRYADPDGGSWEFFSINGTPVMSPYTPDGRPLCPVCGRTTSARLLSRRLVPVPDGGQPRSRWEDRRERVDAPPLQARPEPDQA